MQLYAKIGTLSETELGPAKKTTWGVALEVFTGQIFGPNSNPPHLVGSKSIPPQIQKLMGHPYQSMLSKICLYLYRVKI